VSLKSSLISSISSTTEKVLVVDKKARRFAHCHRERKLLLTVRCIDLAYAPPLDGLQTAALGVKTVPCVHIVKYTYSDIYSFRSK
jgi:hypothetical protein